MKKIAAPFFIVLLLYLLATFSYSLVFGALSFGQGISVGYPTVYYRIKPNGESQGGFTNAMALAFNLIVVLGILFIYKFIIRKNKA